ncbi:MAG: M14-type cytosolic carboxypeptidase [Vicinamibacteraceae bacterium]
MMALLLLAVSVHADFEAGNVGQVTMVAENHVRCAVAGESDKDGRNRQPSWFYFRLDGVAGREMTVDVTGLHGEYNYKPHKGQGLQHTRPVLSHDNRTWQHAADVTWLPEQSAIRVRFRAEKDRIWIARQPPYTLQRLDRLLSDLRGHPDLKEQTIGKSVEGRPLLLLTVTDAETPDPRKKVIWLMARQHAWESGTSWVAEGLLLFLLSKDPQAVRLRQRNIVKLIPICDPDGVARGGVRFNEHGYDLNRNWDAVDPTKMPEIASQRNTILGWVDSGRPIHLFLTLHNTESADYIEGPLTAGGPTTHALAHRFQKLLDDTSAFYAPTGPRDMSATTSPGIKGRMTVSQGLWADRRIPAFLMELMVDRSEKLGREPTVKDRLEFGGDLIRAMAAALPN